MTLKHAFSLLAILAGGAFAAFAQAQPASAADIAVVTTMNIRPALDDIDAGFGKRDAEKVTVTGQGADPTMKLVESGVAADVVIASRQMLERLAMEGLVRPGSIVDVAHSSIAVVVHAGAPRPNIATDADLKRVLLAAGSIAYPDPGQGTMGGNYLVGMFQRMGVADQLKPKSQLTSGGRASGDVVAQGKAEIALNQLSELKPVTGVEFLNPLPPALVGKIVMSAGVLTKSPNPEGAAKWIRYMASADAAAPLRAIGMDP